MEKTNKEGIKDTPITNTELAKFAKKTEGAIRAMELRSPKKFEALLKLYLESKKESRLTLGGDVVMWSTKGGVGKTTLSSEIAAFFNVPVIDCDKNICLDGSDTGGYSSHYEKNEKVDVREFPWNDPLSISELPSPAIYDFGGYLSESRLELEAVQRAKLVIIPVGTDMLDITKAVESYNMIRPYNKNITFILNRYTETETPKQLGDYKRIKQAIEAALDDEISMLKLAQFRIVPIASAEHVPVYQKAQEDSLSKHKYARLLTELEHIFKKISEFTSEE